MSKKDAETLRREEEIKKLNDFLNELKEKQMLITKEANLMGKKRITYCKGKDFAQCFKDNFTLISEKLKEINNNFNLGKEASEHSLGLFYSNLLAHKLLLKVNKYEGDKAKYPKKLMLPKKGEDITTFEESKCYWVNTQTEVSYKGIFLLAILIFLVFICCLFPLWPLKMKINVLWVVFFILCGLLALLLLIIVITIIGFIFGYDIIILPNLGEWKMSWKDRFFNPFVLYDYRKDDDWVMILIRISLACVIASSVFLAIYNPGLFKVGYDYTVGFTFKMYDYAKEKLILAPERRKNELRRRGYNRYQYDLDI